MTSAMNREKHRTMLDLLDRGVVMIHLDPRRDGVSVPEHHAQDPWLRLHIAYGYNLPALDLDDEGVYAVLSFGGRDFGCSFPWESVYALTLPDEEHQGAYWATSLPDENDPFFAGAVFQEGASGQPDDAPGPFQVIEGQGGGTPTAMVEPSPPATKPQPHLRLVKG